MGDVGEEECTRPVTMIHTVHAGTSDGKPLRGFIRYCDVHSQQHLGDPRTLAAQPWQPEGEPTPEDVNAYDTLEADLARGRS